MISLHILKHQYNKVMITEDIQINIPKNVLYVIYKDRSCTFHYYDGNSFKQEKLQVTLNEALQILSKRSESYICLRKNMIIDMLAVRYIDISERKIYIESQTYSHSMEVKKDALNTFRSKRLELFKSKYDSDIYTYNDYFIIKRKNHELCISRNDILLVLKDTSTDYCKVFTLLADNSQDKSVYKVNINLWEMDLVLNPLSRKRTSYDRNSRHFILNKHRIVGLDSDTISLINGKENVVKVPLYGQEHNKYQDMQKAGTSNNWFEMKMAQGFGFTILTEEQTAIYEIIEENRRRAEAAGSEDQINYEVEFTTF